MSRPSQSWPDEFARRYRESGCWTGETFPGMLAERAKSIPDRTAVVDERLRLNYRELNDRAERLAAGLLHMGLARGDRVIVQLPNRAELVFVVFALFRAGIIPVFSLPAHRKSELTHFAAASEARGYIIVDRHDGFDYRTLARDIRSEVPSVEHVLVIGESEEFNDFNSCFGDPSALPAYDVPTSDVALIQLSGGSGGRSKLIPRTTDDYLYSVRASVPIAGLSSESVYLTVLPAAHNFPMSSPGFLGTLYAGGQIVMPAIKDAPTAFEWIEKEGVTHVSLVPPLALLWLDSAGNTSRDISSLEVIQVGGAKLPSEVARKIPPAFGCQLQQVFGMAEGLVNYTRLDDPPEIVNSTQGRPISEHDEILVVDENDTPLPRGVSGRLLTRGPYTIRSYHLETEANRNSFTDNGFYRTGDVVVYREDGYLEVMGRVTDQINRGGEKVSADELEEHLLAHPGIHDAAVVGLADDWLGERTCAFVILRNAELTAPALKRWLRERGIAEFKLPDKVKFVEAFPATGVGKVARTALREALRTLP